MRHQLWDVVIRHDTSLYWLKRWVAYGNYLAKTGGKCDHRIVKADKIAERRYKKVEVPCICGVKLAIQGTTASCKPIKRR